jgi:hypothetical protein
MRRTWKYGLILCLSACRASEPEAIGHVEQATIEDRAADEVYGQVDLFSRIIPPTSASNTVQRPLAVATDTLFRAASNVYYIVDSDAHRVLAINPSSGSFASWVIGQSAVYAGLPNAGKDTVNAQGFFGPTAVAAGGPSAGGGLSYLVVADTSNNRVLFGSGFYSMPWTAGGVLGQRGSFTTNEANIGGIDEYTLSAPQGVAIDGNPDDPGVTPRIYVSDTGNNRVLRCDFGSTVANEVYGQETFDQGAPNRGGAAGKNTLSGPTGIAVYNVATIGAPLLGFYVADTGNNRVLFFQSDVTLHNALRVYGQGGDFTTTTANKGGISASSLSGPTGVAVDPNGGLYVADTGNHRVLHYPPGGVVADQVFGQPSFDTATLAGPSPTTLHGPTGVAVTPNGDLLVADAGNVRVLRYVKGCGPSCDDGDPCTNDFCNPSAGCVHQPTSFSTECSPYRCDPSGHSCMKSCTSAGDCDPSSHAQCRNLRCVSTCGSPAECKSGNCVDGFCCDTACDGPCETCGKAGFEGTCIPVPAGPPARVCPVTVEGECGTRCDGVQGKICRTASPGSACGVESCVDGKQRTRGTCDGTGKCVTEIVTCAPYACGSGGCRTSCEFDYECVGSARCVDGQCTTGFGAESAGGGCAFGRGKETASIFALMLGLSALASRRRRS